MNVLKIDSVYLEFAEREILRGIALTIKTGSIIGLLGSNGTGKSCFLKILVGELKASSVYINYNDKHSKNLYNIDKAINYLPQHQFHPKSLSINTLIELYGINPIEFLTTYPFFKNELSKKFGALSGGLKRLLEVLLVIEAPSNFTILDEPFTHIIPLHFETIKKAIANKKAYKGLIITDHIYQNVLDLADELHLLKEGSLIRINDAYQLKKHGYLGNISGLF